MTIPAESFIHPVVRRGLAAASVFAVSLVATACTDAPTVARAPRESVARFRAIRSCVGASCSAAAAVVVPTSVYAYGVNANRIADDTPNSVFDNGLGSMASLLAQAKVNWVRIDVDWDTFQDVNITCKNGVQPTPNRDWSDHGQFSVLDRQVARATSNGLNVVAVLGYSPLTESSGGCNAPFPQREYPPSSLTGWTSFVSAMVARYPQIAAWEIWNETNAGFFRVTAASGQTKAAAYANLVNAAAPIIHQAGGKVIGVDAAWSPTTQHPTCPQPPASCDTTSLLATTPYVQQIMTSAGNNIDIVSLHYYPVDSQTVVTTINGITSTIKQAAPSSPSVNNIWVTEAGYGTNTPNLISEGTNLTSVLTAMTNGRAPAWTGLFWWHAYNDGTHGNLDNRGIMSGVFTNTIQVRPAYTAYKNFTATHSAALPPTVSVSGPSAIYSYNYNPVTFTSNVVHGTAPFTYYWHTSVQNAAGTLAITSSNGSPSVSVQYYSGNTPGTNATYTLYLTVTDAAGHSGTSSITGSLY